MRFGNDRSVPPRFHPVGPSSRCGVSFCRVEGVEPTNNAAERALRPAVLWRKSSRGTRSDVGSRYVATMLSVAATCKQQGRRVWDYLTQTFAARAVGQAAPSLLQMP